MVAPPGSLARNGAKYSSRNSLELSPRPNRSWRTTGLRCAAPASTTSRTSTSTSRAIGWWSSPACRARASRRSRSTRSTPRGSGGTSSRCRPTPASSSSRWRSRTSISSTGLSPAISIEQKTTGSNPRSTVGTVTEIYDYLRLLFANIGVPHCPNCGKEITSQSLERIVDMVMLYPQDARINVLAPIVRGRKGEFKKELAALAGPRVHQGADRRAVPFARGRIKLDRRRNHTHRGGRRSADRARRRSSGGSPNRSTSPSTWPTTSSSSTRTTAATGCFSRRLACVDCGLSMPEMTPRAFSFNSPHGACPDCQGLGTTVDFDPQRVVPDETKSLADGAIAPWARATASSCARRCRRSAATSAST